MGDLEDFCNRTLTSGSSLKSTPRKAARHVVSTWGRRTDRGLSGLAS